MKDVIPAAVAGDPPARRANRTRPTLPIVVFAALALLPIAARFGAEGYILSLLTRIMILALAAMALDLLLGYSALISFGHAAYIGIGAYAVVILSSNGVDDAIVQLLAAMAAAGLFALVTGAISLRTKGAYFIMITLAFGQMLFFFVSSLALYGGDDGISLPSPSLVFGHPILKNAVVLYYVSFGVLLGTYAACRAMIASRFGRVLRGVRDNPVRMQAIGFAPYRFQLTAYILSGMIAAMSGVLLANQSEFISPAYASWQRSAELIFMVVLGGVGSLHGAIIGAAVYALLSEGLSTVTENWAMIFGPILILVVIFARGGLVGLLKGRS